MPRRTRGGEESPAFSIEETMSTATATAEPEVDLRSLILDLHSKIDRQDAEIASLKERQKQQGAALPKFQAMGAKADYDAIFAGLKRGQGMERDGDQARMIVGTDSFALSNRELAIDPPRFDAGDLVELNLDAVRPYSDKTWGEIYEAACERQRKHRKRLPSKVGRVRHIQYRRDNGEYKYRCIFPGLTGLNPDKDRGDGFDESELLPLGESA